MRRLLVIGVALAVLLAAASLAYIRLAPVDARGWHVDPTAAPDDGHANSWRVGPVADAGVDAVAPLYGVPAAELARALDEVARAERGTRPIAGAPHELWVTYESRSRWVGFPDYVSVRAVERDEGSTLAIFSRARYGRNDVGVNRARVERWLAALAPLEE